MQPVHGANLGAGGAVLPDSSDGAAGVFAFSDRTSDWKENGDRAVCVMTAGRTSESERANSERPNRLGRPITSRIQSVAPNMNSTLIES
jgi:hypothetical protein